jgi:hypothetical protein
MTILTDATIPALLQSTRRTVLQLKTSKVLVRAVFQLFVTIRSEGKGASRSELNVKRIAQMLPLHAALGRFSYLSRRLQTRLLTRICKVNSFVVGFSINL